VESSLTHRFVEVNGVRLHIAEQGQGPLVLLLHGWPESWYSWRHQFGALAAAGYRVVAPTSAATPAASSRRTSRPTPCSTSSAT
jgi:alpha-beta hydrolase superfamily lysophospholipase